MKLQNTIIGLVGLVGFAIVVIAGDTGYATWEVGESPIIILTQHGGSQAPPNNIIPDRVPGCYDSATTTCIWTHDCPTGTIAEDDVHCGDDIITTNDDKSAELATCIRDNVFLSINTIPDLQPHLIKNELKRRKLDTNREIGPAALGVPIAEQAYNEFYDFVENATTDIIPILSTACDWGLIIDVHGQTYDYQSLGYKVSANKLNDPTHLNLAPTVQSSSIRHLVQSHPEVTFSDVLYGPYSLGTFLESEGVLSGSNYTVYPSSNHPNPIADGISNSAYHQGDYTLETYGSSGGGYIDAIQLEVSHEIRIDGVARQQFCLDFSNALVNFVKHWYGNISSLCAIDLV